MIAKIDILAGGPRYRGTFRYVLVIVTVNLSLVPSAYLRLIVIRVYLYTSLLHGPPSPSPGKKKQKFKQLWKSLGFVLRNKRTNCNSASCYPGTYIEVVNDMKNNLRFMSP